MCLILCSFLDRSLLNDTMAVEQVIRSLSCPGVCRGTFVWHFTNLSLHDVCCQESSRIEAGREGRKKGLWGRGRVWGGRVGYVEFGLTVGRLAGFGGAGGGAAPSSGEVAARGDVIGVVGADWVWLWNSAGVRAACAILGFHHFIRF